MSNFYMYRPTGSTQHRLVPWDKDRTFSEFDSSVVAGVDTNVMFRRALAYPDLKTLYLDTLAGCARSAATQFWMEREIVRDAQLIAAAAAEDTLKPYSDDDVASAVSYLRTFARRRPLLVLQEVARLRAGQLTRGSARQLSILDPVRLVGLGAEPAVAIRLVVLVVALEPHHLAVAFERQHVRRDAVEEPAVVADHHRAAGERQQRLFERAQRVDVEVVGRLVEQQQVRAALEQLRQMHAVALAA